MKKLISILKLLINPFSNSCKNKYLHAIINLLPVVFISVLFFFHFFFYEKISENTAYALYAEEVKDSVNIHAILDTVQQQIASRNIDIDFKTRIFLSKTDKNYVASNFYLGRYTAGRSYFIFNRITIAPSNFATNKIEREIDTFKFRRTSDIIVHEIGHIFLRKKLGIFKTFFIDTWKSEGFCEYLANSSTIDIAYAKNIFLNYSLEQEQAIIAKKRFFYAYLRIFYLAFAGRLFVTI